MSVKLGPVNGINGAKNINLASKQTIRPYTVRAPGNVGITKYKRKRGMDVTGPSKRLKGILEKGILEQNTKKIGYPVYDSKNMPPPSLGSGSKPNSGSTPTSGGLKPGSPDYRKLFDFAPVLDLKPKKEKIETVVKPETPNYVKNPLGLKISTESPTTARKIKSLNDLTKPESPTLITRWKNLKNLTPKTASTSSSMSVDSPSYANQVNMEGRLKKLKSKPKPKSPKTPSTASSRSSYKTASSGSSYKPSPTSSGSSGMRSVKYPSSASSYKPSPTSSGSSGMQSVRYPSPVSPYKPAKSASTPSSRRSSVKSPVSPARRFSDSTLPTITKNKATKRKGELLQSSKYNFVKGNLKKDEPKYLTKLKIPKNSKPTYGVKMTMPSMYGKSTRDKRFANLSDEQFKKAIANGKFGKPYVPK